MEIICIQCINHCNLNHPIQIKYSCLLLKDFNMLKDRIRIHIIPIKEDQILKVIIKDRARASSLRTIIPKFKIQECNRIWCMVRTKDNFNRITFSDQIKANIKTIFKFHKVNTHKMVSTKALLWNNSVQMVAMNYRCHIPSKHHQE